MSKTIFSLKKMVFTVAIFAAIIILPSNVNAEKDAGQSASIISLTVNNNNVIDISKKKMAIINVLKRYNSPLLNSVDSFITTCVAYELDCYLLPSITGLESTFGQFIPLNSNNPFGWGAGLARFQNWEDAINEVGKALRQNYIDKGAKTVEQIAPMYATSKTWAPRVNYFINQFEQEEDNISTFIKASKVNL